MKLATFLLGPGLWVPDPMVILNHKRANGSNLTCQREVTYITFHIYFPYFYVTGHLTIHCRKLKKHCLEQRVFWVDSCRHPLDTWQAKKKEESRSTREPFQKGPNLGTVHGRTGPNEKSVLYYTE